MAIVLSHISAYEFWRNALPANGQLKFPQFAGFAITGLSKNPLPHTSYSELRTLNTQKLASELGLALPIHVVVDSSTERLSHEELVSHVFDKRLSKDCSVRLRPGLHVATPETCFIQMTQFLNQTSLIRAGFELCSTYAFRSATHNNSGDALIAQRCQPSSTGKIANAIHFSYGAKGANMARRATSHIIDGAASPRETALTMLLTLPYHLGGFALPKPELNAQITVKSGSVDFLGKQHLYCDLLWRKERLIVEYDSDSFHSGPEQIASDSKRRNELTALGYRVITVTTKQLNSIAETKQIAKMVGRRLGKRIRPSLLDFETRHLELRRCVLANEIAYEKH